MEPFEVVAIDIKEEPLEQESFQNVFSETEMESLDIKEEPQEEGESFQDVLLKTNTAEVRVKPHKCE